VQGEDLDHGLEPRLIECVPEALERLLVRLRVLADQDVDPDLGSGRADPSRQDPDTQGAQDQRPLARRHECHAPI